MKSPFIGMDPYIESPDLWSDFHSNLASQIQIQLNAQIQPHYFATLETTVVYQTIEVGKQEKYVIYPDVDVRQQQRQSVADAVLVPDSPRIVAPIESRVVYEEPHKQYWVAVRTVPGRDVVTVIEILSPVNKNPKAKAHKDYLRKRQHLFRSVVHLLEIDLLRGGVRPPLEEAVPQAPYYVMLSREEQRPQVEVWPIQLSEALPLIPVPLRTPDPDAVVDLGLALTTIYKNGAYSLRIDYQQPVPPPKLSPPEQTWVDELLIDYNK